MKKTKVDPAYDIKATCMPLPGVRLQERTGPIFVMTNRSYSCFIKIESLEGDGSLIISSKVIDDGGLLFELEKNKSFTLYDGPLLIADCSVISWKQLP